MSKGRRGRKGGNRQSRPDSRALYWQSQAYSEQLFQMFRNDLIELAMCRFAWINLPNTCNERFLEQTLLYEGCATIAHPNGHDAVLSLRAVQQGAPNMYDEPREWRAMGITGRTNFMCDWENAVWIWDNRTRYPLISKINMWARELADIMQVKQINRFHMRMPFMITANQDRALDLRNFYRNVANGEPVMLGFSTLEDININATLPERAREYIGDKFDAEFKNTWDAIYRELGIDSMPFKEERMIEDEVSSTMQPTEIARLSPLACRRAACEKINARMGNLLSAPIGVVWARDNISANYDMAHRYDSLEV